MAGSSNPYAPDGEAVDLREQVVSLTAELAAIYQVIDDREVIAQAQGLIMCLAGCDAQEAFAVLVSRARADGRTVEALAAGLVRAHEGTARRSG